MNKKEFTDFLKKYFLSHGFEKINNRFYSKANDFLCEIYPQKSVYGDIYYLNFYFYFGTFEKPYKIERGGAQTCTPSVGSRFYFSAQDRWCCTIQNYTESELITILDRNLNTYIIPPFEIGKIYLSDFYREPLYSSLATAERLLPYIKIN